MRERVEALDAGADARVRARLRRDGSGGIETAEVLGLGGLMMNLATREYELLHALLKKPNRVQERQKLVQEVWGKNHYGDANLLDV